MDKFLETYNLSRLNHEEMENMSGLTTGKETGSVTKNFPTNKSPGPENFIGKFYQKFKKGLTPILLKVFQKIEEEGMLPNLFYGTHHYPYTKTRQGHHKKGKYKTTFLVILNNMLANQI